MPRKAPPAFVNVLQQLARTGDLAGLVRQLDGDSFYTITEKMSAIRQALQNTAANDMPGLMEQAYREMLTFTMELLIRAQHAARRTISAIDGSNRIMNQAIDTEVVNQQLPVIEKLQQQVLTLSRTYASIQHTLAMSKPAESPAVPLKLSDYQPQQVAASHVA
jgi:hypothetical protein